MRVLHDITVPLDERTASYPGDPRFRREVVSTVDSGGWEVGWIHVCAHTGTHLDAAAHLLADGRRLDDYPPQAFVTAARVIEIAGGPAIGPADLEAVDTRPGEAILFATDNSRSGRVASGALSEEYVHLSPAAARWCVEAGAPLVGIDYLSVDPPGCRAAHEAILSAGLLILEMVNLAGVAPGRYTLICPPPAVSGAESCPVRALLAETPD